MSQCLSFLVTVGIRRSAMKVEVKTIHLRSLRASKTLLRRATCAHTHRPVRNPLRRCPSAEHSFRFPERTPTSRTCRTIPCASGLVHQPIQLSETGVALSGTPPMVGSGLVAGGLSKAWASRTWLELAGPECFLETSPASRFVKGLGTRTRFERRDRSEVAPVLRS